VVRIAVTAEFCGYRELLRFPSAEGVCGLFDLGQRRSREGDGSEPNGNPTRFANLYAASEVARDEILARMR